MPLVGETKAERRASASETRRLPRKETGKRSRGEKGDKKQRCVVKMKKSSRWFVYEQRVEKQEIRRRGS